MPVLDVRRKFTNKIIGDRSFSSSPKIVSKLGDYSISKYHKHHIGTIIKHIPGHGLALVDSHNNLPVVNANVNEIYKKDIKEGEINNLIDNHKELKNEIESTKNSYEKIIDETAKQIDEFVEKVNLENPVQ